MNIAVCVKRIPKTAEADMKLDSRGRVVQDEDEEFGDNVLIVPQGEPG